MALADGAVVIAIAENRGYGPMIAVDHTTHFMRALPCSDVLADARGLAARAYQELSLRRLLSATDLLRWCPAPLPSCRLPTRRYGKSILNRFPPERSLSVCNSGKLKWRGELRVET